MSQAVFLRWLLASAPLLGVICWIWVTQGDAAGAAGYFEHWRHADPQLTRALKLITNWGNKAFYVPYAALLLWGWRTGRRHWVRVALAYVAAQVLFSFLLVNASKIAIGKPRPGVGGLFQPFTLDAGHHAWPSGHTAEVTGSSLPPVLMLRGIWVWLACLLAGACLALMGFSRMYLGWHSPSDVLTGWLVGSLAALGIAWFGGPHGSGPHKSDQGRLCPCSPPSTTLTRRKV